MDSRTGERVLLRDLVKDGHTGLPVTRRSYEPKHPQERPVDVFDPQVLRRPAPDLDRPAYEVHWPTGSWDDLFETYRPLTAHFSMGTVTIDTTISDTSYVAPGYVVIEYVE